MFLNKQNRFFLLLFFAMLSWGISWSNAKVVGEYLPSKTIMFWRFFIASLSLMPVVFIYSIKFKELKDSLMGIIFGSILLIIYNYCYFRGTYHGLAGLGGVIVTTLVPVFTILLSKLVFKTKLNKLIIIGIILGLISGVLIMKLWKYSINDIFDNGNKYFILGAFIWSVLSINIQKSTQKINTLFYSFISFVIATIMLVIIDPKVIDLTIFYQDSRFWVHFLSVTLGAMSFGTVAFFYAIKYLGSHKAGTFVFIVPASALGFSIWILNEIPDLITFIGSVLAMIAVFIINFNHDNID